jgi:hypothetical protein
MRVPIYMVIVLVFDRNDRITYVTVPVAYVTGRKQNFEYRPAESASPTQKVSEYQTKQVENND